MNNRKGTKGRIISHVEINRRIKTVLMHKIGDLRYDINGKPILDKNGKHKTYVNNSYKKVDITPYIKATKDLVMNLHIHYKKIIETDVGHLVVKVKKLFKTITIYKKGDTIKKISSQTIYYNKIK